MMHKFEERLEVNLLDFESLPATSKKIMFNHYDTEINSPYSFDNRFSKLPPYIRERSNGGFAGPFHRHAESNCENPELYPDAVTSTPNGDPIMELLGLDYNALYGYAIGEYLPGGVGLLYEKLKNGKYKLDPMTNRSGWSLDEICWINYMQNQPPFQNDKEFQRIRHHLNGGQKKFTFENFSFIPDGHVTINDVTWFFFYHGTVL